MVEMIAEVSSNHMGKLDRALMLIEAAAVAGADTVKFQYFHAETLWRENDPRYHTTLPLSMPPAWIPRLQQQCSDQGVSFLCTPFSEEAVLCLQDHGVTRYKVASGDITYFPMLQRIAQTGQPVILSTGFASYLEISRALDILDPRGERNKDITLLHCTGGYPTKPEDMALRRILSLGEEFWCPVGLSSHWREWYLDLIGVAYGVVCIEKHFDLDGAGIEAGHSLFPMEFRSLVEAVKKAHDAVGDRWINEGTMSQDDLYARINYRRDESDWLRPVMKENQE